MILYKNTSICTILILCKSILLFRLYKYQMDRMRDIHVIHIYYIIPLANLVEIYSKKIDLFMYKQTNILYKLHNISA
ncbi:MAG: hypothetical protein Faunusvirus10_3 [Faunusvirus sp.]|jgi:hypothetical protein|uniref:Uncharacterized protein n=1 Tax=Faunusvirus sp. TaxID=2487766 RepID=A0A3G4ZWX0_9VIRU|nr:MAG: hypothetical protein Faunusvirus10_3 [Faunusvirus sp.]